MMTIAEKIMFALSVFSIGYIFLQLLSLTVLLKFPSPAKKQAAASTYRPFVSILKPVRGIDAGGYENFKSFCNLDYPNYELIFGVAEKSDLVIEQIKALQKEFPHLPIHLALSSKEIGHNPKVNNLANAYDLSRGEVIVMSDSDVRVEPDYLQHAVSPLANKKIGLVTAVVMAFGAKTFWAGLHALLVNGGIGGVYSLLYQMGRLDMGFGPSLSIRREVLEEIGGFQPIKDFVAEDNLIGFLVKQRGYKVVMQTKIVKVYKESSDWSQQDSQILRWLVAGGKHTRFVTWIIPLFFATHVTLTNLILFRNERALVLLAIAIGSRTLFYMVMSFFFVKEPRLIRYLWGILWAEMAFAYIWFKSIYTNRVIWRGRWYRVFSGGRMERLEGIEEADIALLGEAA